MDNKRNKNIQIIFILLSIFISIFTLIFILNNETSVDAIHKVTHKVQFNGTYSTIDNMTQKPIPSDHDLKLSDFQYVYLEGHFDQAIEENKQVIMRIDNMNVKVFINHSLIFDNSTYTSAPSHVRSNGNGWEYFVSPGITPQDVVKIELQNNYSNHTSTAFQLFLDHMFSGYEGDLVANIIKSNFSSYIASIVIICLGVLTLIFSFFLHRMHRPTLRSIIFSCLAIASGIWFSINFTVQNYFIPYPIFNNSLDILSLLFTASFLLLYYSYYIESKLKYLLHYIAYSSFALIVIASIMQMLGVADYYDFVFAIEFIAVIAMVSLFGSVCYEVKTKGMKNNYNMMISTFVLCLGIFGDLVSNYFQILSYMVWFKIGFTLFLLIQFYDVWKQVQYFIGENMKMNALKTQTNELSKMVRYQQLVTEATQGLYDAIYEINLTTNRATNETTELLNNYIGLDTTKPYDQTIQESVMKRIKEEFQQGYLDVFLPEKALTAFKEGNNHLSYEYQMKNMDGKYQWVRSTGRIFNWRFDDSIRMVIFRQNIHIEKEKELELSKRANLDLMTMLYNKVVTEDLIRQTILEHPNLDYAFGIIDLDNFKEINDRFGHALGDKVIIELSKELKRYFSDEAIIGRVGGDEFVVFERCAGSTLAMMKAKSFVEKMNQDLVFKNHLVHVSISMGLSFYPYNGKHFESLYKKADRALYLSKSSGKNICSIYEKGDK